MVASVNVGPSAPKISTAKVAPPRVSTTLDVPKFSGSTLGHAAVAAERAGKAASPTLIPRTGGAPTPNQAAAHAAAASSSSYAQYQAYLGSNMGRQPSLLSQLTDPIIQAYTAQGQAGAKQIAGLTATYAKQLGNIGAQSAEDYTSAEGQQAALDAAVAQSLQGNVGAGASALQAALARSGQDVSPATQAAQAATGTAGSMYASGSAGLTALINEAAAQKTYNAQLPGIAKLAGLQAVGAYGQGIASAEQAAISKAQGLVPSLMNAQTNQDRAQAYIAAQEAKAAQPKFVGSGSTGYYEVGPNGQLQQVIPAAPRSTGSSGGGTKVKTFSSNGNEYALDPSGKVTQLTFNPPTRGGKSGVAGGKGMTEGEISSFLKGIPVYQTVHTNDGTGNTTSKRVVAGVSMNYLTAYKALRAGGVSDVEARAKLDTIYPRGGGGRAWLTNEEQAALGRAKLPTGVVSEKDAKGNPIHFLSMDQFKALQKSGHQPPGYQAVVNGKKGQAVVFVVTNG